MPIGETTKSHPLLLPVSRQFLIVEIKAHRINHLLTAVIVHYNIQPPPVPGIQYIDRVNTYLAALREDRYTIFLAVAVIVHYNIQPPPVPGIFGSIQ